MRGYNAGYYDGRKAMKIEEDQSWRKGRAPNGQVVLLKLDHGERVQATWIEYDGSYKVGHNGRYILDSEVLGWKPI